MKENQIVGERAYEFVAAFPYIRESGTDGEKRAAGQILKYLEKDGISARKEPFTYKKICTVHGVFTVTEPYKKTYPVTFMTLGEPFQTDMEAPFLYVENGDAISLTHADGKIILVNEPCDQDAMKRIIESGALAVISIFGTPLDDGRDQIAAERKMPDLNMPDLNMHKIPGARIHLRDAWELVEKGASRARFFVKQEWKEIASENVVVRIPGKRIPEEVMTFTAHYDSVPAGPGAYDNMSGCAIVMELCRYFNENRPERTMEFIWFGSEEKGLRGSIAYVRAHEEELLRHRFHMNVDLAGQMIGGTVAGVTAGEEVCNFIWETAKKADKGLEIKRQIWSSDSNTFAWKGIPAMTLNRDGFGMHTSHDTIEWISPWSLKRSVIILGTLAETCDQAEAFPFERKMPDEFVEKLDSFFQNYL